jgi:hypothetical protein
MRRKVTLISTLDGNNTQEELVAKTEKIDALISTVRELNHRVRPMLNEGIGGGQGNQAQAHTILGEMRNRELVASHGVKRVMLSNREGIDAMEIKHMMGTDDARITLEEALEIHQDPEKLPTRVLLSEFGSAREAILSLVRELPDEQWEAASSTLGEGDLNSVEAIVDNLIAEDQVAVRKINELLTITA